MATRSEKVRLELEDQFTTGMARAAAATALLGRELKSLSGTSVSTSRDTDKITKSTTSLGDGVSRTSAKLRSGSDDLNRYSGRLRLLTEAATALGPALIPVGAAAIPAIAGLTAGLGALAGSIGVAALAFGGLGDSMDALDAYQLEPTTENLVAMREEFAKIGPAGSEFVRYLDSLEPELRSLQMTARAGLFPGVEEGIDSLLTLLPQIRPLIFDIASEMGSLASRAGEALSGDGFASFFDYVKTDAAPTLRAFAEATGNVAEGLANLIVDMAPLSRDFTGGLVEMTRAFADWSAGLSGTEGFQSFLAYVRESGPQAAELLGAVANAFVQIVQAAAPVGQTILPVLTSLANVLAAIADSPIGPSLFTAAAGFAALSRGTKLLSPSIGGLSDAFLDLRTSPNLAATAVERFGRAGKVAAGAAGMGLLITSLSETNDSLAALEGAAGGALAGFSVGGPWGAAVGGAIGLVTSLGQAHEDTAAEVDALAASYDRQTGAITENTRATAVQRLQQDGLLDDAERLGIATSTLTNAVLGNADAQAVLNAALAGYDVDHSISQVDDLRKSFSDAEIQTILNDRAATNLRDHLPGLTGKFESAGAQAKQFASAMNEGDHANRRYSASAVAARDAARETAKGFITLGDSLNDSKVSLGEWITQMRKQASALANFAENAVRAAKRGLDDGLIRSLKEAGPEGALRMRQLANATDSELGRANRAWRAGQEAIREYVNTQVPPKKVKVDTSQATTAIDHIRAQLASIPRSIRTTYYVPQLPTGSPFAAEEAA